MKPPAKAVMPCLALLFAPMLRAEDPASVSPQDNGAKPSIVTITPDKDTVMPGEPFYVAVAATNIKVGKYAILPSHVVLNGPHFAFLVLELKDAEGTPASWPGGSEKWDDYGIRMLQYDLPSSIFSKEKAAAEEQWHADSGSETRRVLLLPDFKHAGDYTFDLQSEYSTPENEMKISPQTPKLTVIPYDHEKMAAVVDELGKTAMAISGPPTEAQFESWKKLEAIHDDLAVPWLIRLLHGDDNLTRLRAIHALEKFNNDAAIAALEEGTRFTAKDIPKQTDAKSAESIVSKIQWESAIALLDNPHPGAFPYLVKMYLQPGGDWLGDVIFGGLQKDKLPPKEALPLALKLLKSNNYEGYDLADLKNLILRYKRKLGIHP